VLAASVAAYALLQSLVVPVLATIQIGLHTSQNTVTWVLTAYLLAASICTPIIGRLGDMWGKERMLVVSLLALMTGSLVAAVAHSVLVMVVGRVIQGIGGGVLPLAFGLIRDEFPPEKVTGAIGALAGLVAAGAGLGIVAAGPVVSVLNYHWLFWIPAIALAVTAVVAHLVVPESSVRTPGRLNPASTALLSGWLLALVLAISEAPVWGWGSTKVVGLVLLAAVLFVGWVAVESRAAQPLIDMRMMRVPAVWTTNLVALLLGVGMYAGFAFLPEFIQTPRSAGYGFGATVTQSGLILLPSSVTMFAFGLWSGRLTWRFGAKTVLVTGMVISIGSFAILTLAHGQEWELYLAMGIQGLGYGLAFSAVSALVVAAVPPAQTGVASGMNANIRTIGGSIGAAVMSSVVTAGVHPGALPKQSGYTLGFGLLTVASVAAAGAALLVPGRLTGEGHRRSAGSRGPEADTVGGEVLAAGPAGRSLAPEPAGPELAAGLGLAAGPAGLDPAGP
jgi:EmrB/QacA subfamily drug resistance transporter